MEFNQSLDTTLEQYASVIETCTHLVAAKNHDYGDAWREMTFESLIDRARNKMHRIRNMQLMERAGEKPMISDGIDAELVDIINYCVFALIKWNEQDDEDFLNEISL